MIFIGEDVTYNGKQLHVQDIDRLQGLVYVGTMDNNGICHECKWIDIKEIKKINEEVS